jgi:hypothetical protein
VPQKVKITTDDGKSYILTLEDDATPTANAGTLLSRSGFSPKPITDAPPPEDVPDDQKGLLSRLNDYATRLGNNLFTSAAVPQSASDLGVLMLPTKAGVAGAMNAGGGAVRSAARAGATVMEEAPSVRRSVPFAERVTKTLRRVGGESPKAPGYDRWLPNKGEDVTSGPTPAPGAKGVPYGVGAEPVESSATKPSAVEVDRYLPNKSGVESSGDAAAISGEKGVPYGMGGRHQGLSDAERALLSRQGYSGDLINRIDEAFRTGATRLSSSSAAPEAAGATAGAQDASQAVQGAQNAPATGMGATVMESRGQSYGLPKAANVREAIRNLSESPEPPLAARGTAKPNFTAEDVAVFRDLKAGQTPSASPEAVQAALQKLRDSFGAQRASKHLGGTQGGTSPAVETLRRNAPGPSQLPTAVRARIATDVGQIKTAADARAYLAKAKDAKVIAYIQGLYQKFGIPTE